MQDRGSGDGWMKKRWVWMGIMVLASLCLIGGCAGGTQPVAGQALTDDDLTFSIGNQTTALDTDATPLVESLGPALSFSETPSVNGGGNDQMYVYAHLTLCTYPAENDHRIGEIILTDATYATRRDIRVGASQSDVTAVYGSDYTVEDGMYTYTRTQSGDLLYFEFDANGRVQSIHALSTQTIAG